MLKPIQTRRKTQQEEHLSITDALEEMIASKEAERKRLNFELSALRAAVESVADKHR